MLVLKDAAPQVELCVGHDFVPLSNGIFDYRTKTLRPFDPHYVFVSKSCVSWVPGADSPVIPTPDDDCEIEEWMRFVMNEDEELVELIWQVLGALLRPLVNFDTAAFFYGASGNNAKGTTCALGRNLLGGSSHCSVKLNDMGNDFLLEPIVGKQTIIVDDE